MPTPVRAQLNEYCRDAAALEDHEVISCAGINVQVHFTPGPTSDSVCFTLNGVSPHLFTGDTVLGRRTTILDHPDGTLEDYLASLDRLLRGDDIPLHPAHSEQPLPRISCCVPALRIVSPDWMKFVGP